MATAERRAGWIVVPARFRVGLLLGWALLGLAGGRPAQAACQEASLMLVHPTVSAPYATVIAQLQAGLAEGADTPIGVCTPEDLAGRGWPRQPRQVVTVGAEADAAARTAFPTATRLPILVRTLPPEASQGLSLFIAPGLVLATLHRLVPTLEAVTFVHRPDLPADWLARAAQAAAAQGLRWNPLAVDGLPAAAQAIETLPTEVGPHTAVWFHRGVLELNPDILLPPLVRRSWDARIPVVADDAEAVARGLLLALTPDYPALGRAAAAQVRQAGTGLADLTTVRRVLNRRTAQAIGLTVPRFDEEGFDHVYE
jgi:hypothetical protein